MDSFRDRRVGLLLGFVSTAALAGVLYVFAQFQILSFVPLDIAEAIAHVTPGQLATQGIESLGAGAKIVVEVVGVLIFLFVGTMVGAVLVRQRGYTQVSNGLPVGLVGLVLTVMVQALGQRFPDVVTLGVTAVLFFGWGVGLVALLRGALGSPTVALEAHDAGVSGLDRRAFVRRSSGVLLTVAVGGTALGELFRRNAEEIAASGGASGLPGASLPRPTLQAAEPSLGAGVVPDPGFVPGVGVRPELTSTKGLYEVATAFRAPSIDVQTWHLTIKGLVDRPQTLTYDELRALPRVDQTSTLTCISNEVGGSLIGNITWSGTRLRDLLQRAGIRPGAVDVVLRSFEGYSDSVPLDRAMNIQNLIVYGMNDAALTVNHGFPARLIVPGIYGMKNVKWLTEIEVVGDDYKGFWEQRGWSDSAIVKTQSVIDTGNPELGNRKTVTLEKGGLVVGGYAFAGDRGVSLVEVQIDDGDWEPAQLKRPTSALTWRAWRYDWAATPGRHTIAVRATDGAGALQTDALAQPHPDGASGWHRLEVEVVG